MPRFDYSAMDGYAVDTSGLSAEFPIRLKVTGSIAASRTVGKPVLRNGCAFRILTGAPIPGGADAVVAQEDVRREGDRIILSRAPRPGDNIRRRGEDVAPGDSLIEACNTPTGPLQVGVAAACGYPGVRMFRKLRVAIFTTGSELRQPGESIQPVEPDMTPTASSSAACSQSPGSKSLISEAASTSRPNCVPCSRRRLRAQM